MNYLIYGNSFNLIDREVNKILNGRIPTYYSLEDVALKDILEDVGYSSMFDDEKTIIVKNFEVLNASKKENDAVLKSLETYLKEPNENATIIFVSKEKMGTRSAIKGVVSKMKVIETPIITKSYELVKVFGNVLRESGYRMNQNTIEEFCLRCATNYDIAISEFAKLIKIKGGNKVITEDDIINYVSNYNLSDSFGFKDAVINLKIKEALSMLDDLESSKMEIVPIVVMLAKEYQALYNIKLLANKKYTNEQIGSEMGGMHPYRVKLLREAASKYTLEKLEKLIVYLCNLDLKLISEDNLGYDELRKFFLEL